MACAEGLVERHCALSRAAAAIRWDRSSGRRTLVVWDDWCLDAASVRANGATMDLNDCIPLFTASIGNDSCVGLDMHVYDIDEQSLAVFVCVATAKAVFMKHLFVVLDPISRVQMVHEYQQSFDGIVGARLCASREACRVVCWTITSALVLDDELKTSIPVHLGDYLAVKTSVVITSAALLFGPVPVVLALLRQGVLLGWNLDDLELVIQQDVSVDGATEELVGLFTAPLGAPAGVLVCYRALARRYEILATSDHVVCREIAAINLTKALRSDIINSHAAAPSATDTESSTVSVKKSLRVVTLGAGLLGAQGVVVTVTDGFVLCDEMLQKRGFCSHRALGIGGPLSSASVTRGPEGVRALVVSAFQRGLRLVRLLWDEGAGQGQRLCAVGSPLKASPVKAPLRALRSPAAPVPAPAPASTPVPVRNIADNLGHVEDLATELDFFRPVEPSLAGSLLAPAPPSPTPRAVSTAPKTRTRGDWEAPQRDAQGKLKDQPVTFHTRIKSSGYGQPAPPKGIKGRGAAPTRSASASRLGAPRPAASATSGKQIRMYPDGVEMMDCHQPQLDYSDGGAASSPVLHMAFNPDGSRLALACSGKDLVVLKTPKSSGRGAYDSLCFSGHNNSVTSVAFSHQRGPTGKYSLLSASRDHTAKIWSEAKSDTPLVDFTHIYRAGDVASQAASASALLGSSRMLGATAKTRNRPFNADVQRAVYFYHDQFVLLSVKASLFMYKYSPAEAAPGELTRFLRAGSYELHHHWDLGHEAGGGRSICALAAMNAVQSPLIMVSTSDKQVHVIDASSGGVLRSFTHTHEKNLSSLTLPTPSRHVALPMHAFNIFLTNAPDSTIMLYDLRSSAVSHRFSDHQHRREAIHNAFSPTCKYIATGSEDNSVYMYDLAMQRYIKHSEHRDVVTSVAFHPILPQLASAGYDGKVKFYTDLSHA